MIMIIKTMSRGGGETGREKRRAPMTKSSWSAIGSEDPGGRSSRRLMKDLVKSPVNAPSDSMNPSIALYGNRALRTKPTNVPINKPKKKPR